MHRKPLVYVAQCRVPDPKTNLGLAKSPLQRKTRGYVQKRHSIGPRPMNPPSNILVGLKKICLKECLCNQQQLVCDECYNGDKLTISFIYFIPLN